MANEKKTKNVVRPRTIDRRVKDRWTPLIVANGYVPIALSLLLAQGDLKITSRELNLIVQMMAFKWDGRMPFPYTTKLAQRMGTSSRSVRDIVSSLEKKGFIKRTRVEGRIANRYDLRGLFAALESWIVQHPTPLAKEKVTPPTAPTASATSEAA